MKLRTAAAAGSPALALLLVAGFAVPASATPTPDHGRPGHGGSGAAAARDDAYLSTAGRTIRPRAGVLDNDGGASGTIVAHTSPAHGTLDLGADGRFSYMPAAGFTGVDTFTYTTSSAVRLYPTDLPPLATIGGVPITGGAYGSSLAPVPGHSDEYYGLTDRGPNVDAPDGGKVEPIPSFTPAIGRFRLVDGVAKLVQRIPLRASDGTPLNGQVNGTADTGETIYDLNGKVLPKSPNGYDPEGLVALRDGTFWVSDEYGPFITHFGRDGRAIERLSPYDGSLPEELRMRMPNKGMEGLSITPDGRTLVGVMQSALQTPDLTKNPKNVAPVRIVTYDLRTKATHEYLYLLQDPDSTGTAVSEITALSATRFLVDERDGKAEPGAFKRFYEIDLADATDVGPAAKIAGAEYDAAKGGLLIGGASIEAFAGKDPTVTVAARLAAAGIRAVSKKLSVDLGALVTTLDPTGGFFGHDKIEGVATPDGGRTLVVSNDSDFGIDGLTTTAPPYQLHVKTQPNGKQDDGELLAIDTARLGETPTTATVSIYVTPPDVHDERGR